MACQSDDTPTREHPWDNDCEVESMRDESDFDLSAVLEYNLGSSTPAVQEDTASHYHNDDVTSCSSPAGIAEDGLSNTLAPEPGQDRDFAEFCSAPSSPGTPFPGNSTPQQSHPVFAPALGRISALHRRSVSEPPDGSVPHHYQHRRPVYQMNPPPTVTFTRDGHFLGIPKSRGPSRTKSGKKSKHFRSSPYQKNAECNVGPGSSQSHHLDKAITRPGRGAPTSNPNESFSCAPVEQLLITKHQPPMHNNGQDQAMPWNPQFIRSRFCTPDSTQAPAVQINPQYLINPQLHNPVESHAGFIVNREIGPNISGICTSTQGPSTAVWNLGVQELHSMITDIVQKAIGALHQRPSREPVYESNTTAGSLDDKEKASPDANEERMANVVPSVEGAGLAQVG